MKTLLFIDDDHDFRSYLSGLLREAQWEVIEAPNGEEGIALAREHRPEIILCDLMMPRGNGYFVCKQLKNDPAMLKTKIVVLTGRDYPTDRRSADEAGADEYLVKPIAFDRLQSVLERVLGSGAARPASDAAPAPGVTRLKFWGVRGSIPTPGASTVYFGGNTSCVEIRAEGKIIILDAGSGIRPLGESLSAEFGARPIEVHLLISHTHWDHIQGFPFFMPAYDAKNRVHILGMEGAHAGLAATLAGQMESPYFPIALKEMPGSITIQELRDYQAEIGPIKVRACRSNHADITVGYRLSTPAGDIAYLPDNESFHHGDDGSAAMTEVEQALVEFIRGVDILICDAQYDCHEYKQHIGWGHGCVDDVVRFALVAEVKRLYLFHHDPSHDDRKISSMLVHARDLARAAGSGMEIEAAREGDQCILFPRGAEARK